MSEMRHRGAEVVTSINSLAPSLIRTNVPVVIGAILAWLVGNRVIDATTSGAVSEGLINAVTGLTIAGYYTLVRLMERKWPGVGILLGSTQQPAVYVPGEVVKSALSVEQNNANVQLVTEMLDSVPVEVAQRAAEQSSNVTVSGSSTNGPTNL